MLRLVTVLAYGMISCGSPAATRAPVPRAVEVLPDATFAELDRDQRAELMKTHVLPAMTPVFQRHDRTKFATVDCKTCHAEGDWTMPNRELAVLDLEDLSAHEPADVEWMKTEIVPAMRKLLRDPTLRCARCHPVAGP
jgi:hypothetical protein